MCYFVRLNYFWFIIIDSWDPELNLESDYVFQLHFECRKWYTIQAFFFVLFYLFCFIFIFLFLFVIVWYIMLLRINILNANLLSSNNTNKSQLKAFHIHRLMFYIIIKISSHLTFTMYVFLLLIKYHQFTNL